MPDGLVFGRILTGYGATLNHAIGGSRSVWEAGIAQIQHYPVCIALRGSGWAIHAYFWVYGWGMNRYRGLGGGFTPCHACW
jgi:hypothetical protein